MPTGIADCGILPRKYFSSRARLASESSGVFGITLHHLSSNILTDPLDTGSEQVVNLLTSWTEQAKEGIPLTRGSRPIEKVLASLALFLGKPILRRLCLA